MNRPIVICHMVQSLDGKVTGEFLFRPDMEPATEIYYEINRRYAASFACGRVTMEESFTKGWYPDLSAYEPVEQKRDFVLKDETGFYAVAFDPRGKLGWQSDRIVDDDPGYGGAKIVEVLTQQAAPRYLGYLEAMNIPYIFAGETVIDVPFALHKLKEQFGIERLLLEGGSILNGAFERSDAIDELSLVVAPIVGGGSDKPLFMDSHLSSFTLANIQTYDHGILWLHYRRKA